jgi:ubiquinone/menaquinone biosynthesis C-methylase UbiE
MGETLATLYDPLIAPFDPLGVRKWRAWVVREARGRVLEIGIGTGLNLKHYRAAESIAAIDPDGASLQRAHAKRNGQARAIALSQSRAEELPFADESFDAVVGTLTFCSIGDPARALAQARRVLKPGGMFRLIEHVRVENRVIAGLQDWATPWWKEIAGNCHLNRDTRAEIARAGFQIRAVRKHLGGLFIGIDAVK